MKRSSDIRVGGVIGVAMDVQIRVAQESDAAGACEVLRRSITECCTKDHGNDQTLLSPWLENKTPENLRQWIGAPGSYGLVAEIQGEIVGVAMMLDSGEVTLCYLIPEVLHKGVGKALLGELESKGRALGLRELRLNSTKTAFDFYSRNGFKSSGAQSMWHGIGCYPMAKVLGSH